MRTPLLFLALLCIAALAACTGEDRVAGRGPLGKADLAGTCFVPGGDSCGEQSVDGCWCDDQCESFGDCCADKAQACGGGGDLCEDFVPPCQDNSDCGDGFECVSDGGCNPSACGCDPTDGSITCTADCSGKVCVAVEEPDLCEDFVPPCQDNSDCGDGFECVSDGGCNPSACGCDPTDGSITCTTDCSGKVCVPEDPPDLCEGFVPPCQDNSDCGIGSECVVDPSTCTASACSCDPATGSILCTADCNGKECVPVAPPNACEAQGGECVGLAPGSCPSGNFGDPADCGGGVGVACCLP